MQKAGFLASAFIAAALGFSGTAEPAYAETRHYLFNIAEKTVNYTGENVTAISVGNSIPGPTLHATVGDTLRATFCNKLAVESSIHWHGILLPNDQDGVPYLNTTPIAPNRCHTFQFPIKHHGTYWYHSHSHLQEQRGVYGAIVLHPKDGEKIETDHDSALVLSDWNDENPSQTTHNLRRKEGFYDLKKDTVQSWNKVIANGQQAIRNRLKNSWNRMPPMDLADVGYDAFLANGQKTFTLPDVHHGDKVRLRIVNAAASSYFRLQFAGGPMKVVSADGVDVQPFEQDTLRIGMAETYDVVLSMPHDGRAYELRATSIDGSGYSSTIIGGSKNIVKAPDIPPPNLFLMDHSAHGGHAGHGTTPPQAATAPTAGSSAHGDHSAHAGHTAEKQGPARDMREYEMLRGVEPVIFDARRNRSETRLELTGDMRGFLWSFDNKMLSEADLIKIKKGEVARFTLVNKTMMNHPIHLHGHFFRVLNGQGDFSPLKHTVNLPPFETVTIEFAADEDKDWMFHCHNLYHMMTGMARVVSYEGTPENPQAQHLHHDREAFAFGEIGLQQNKGFASGRLNSGRNDLLFNYDGDLKGDYDIDLHAEHTFNPYFKAFVGGDFDREPENNNRHRQRAVAGFHYLLPMMIDAEVRVDHTGRPRLELSSETELTSRLGLVWRINTDKEVRLRLEYALDNKHAWKITAGYDSDFGAGIGLKFGF